ncbi:UNVERIFIED_CONTAM: hypothetical protein HDU68_006562 [Siphonaria sp. JEL0065]|nr:hypothetical protein HDU68_006562 [Siphonaria sp. JEL0065]
MMATQLATTPTTITKLLQYLQSHTTVSTFPYPLAGILIGSLITLCDLGLADNDDLNLFVITRDQKSLHLASVELDDPNKVNQNLELRGIEQGNLLAALLAYRDGPNSIWFSDNQSESQELLKLVFTTLNSLYAEEQHPHLFLAGWECKTILDVRKVVKEIVWDDHPYGVYVLDDEVSLGSDVIAVGQEWMDDSMGKRFVMDHLARTDVEEMKKLSTVPYSDEYFDLVFGNPQLVNLSRCVREIVTKDGQEITIPVSWALVHSNYSVGLASTIETHTKKGLAAKATASLVKGYREFMDEQWEKHIGEKSASRVRPYCFILHDNVASKRVFEGKLGFRRLEGEDHEWMGVRF